MNDNYDKKQVPDAPKEKYHDHKKFDEKFVSERPEQKEADPLIRDAMKKEGTNWEHMHEQNDLDDTGSLYSGSETKMEIVELEDNVRKLVQKGRFTYRYIEDYLLSLRYNLRDIRQAFRRVTGVDPQKYLSKLKVFENAPKEIPPVTLGWGESSDSKYDYYFIMPYRSGYEIFGQKGDRKRDEVDYQLSYENALKELNKKTKKVYRREEPVNEDIKMADELAEVLDSSIKTKTMEYKNLSDYFNKNAHIVTSSEAKALINGALEEDKISKEEADELKCEIGLKN